MRNRFTCRCRRSFWCRLDTILHQAGIRCRWVCDRHQARIWRGFKGLNR